MTEEPKKKNKMNFLGYLSIAVSLALMVFAKYQAFPDSSVFVRLLEGVLAYFGCFLGAGLITVILWLGMYCANLFLNNIFDKDEPAPSWDNAGLMLLVIFAILYVLQIIGKDIIIR